MPNDECDDLHTHAEELHAIAKDTFKAARKVGSFDPTFISRMKSVVIAETLAQQVDARIKEDC